MKPLLFTGMVLWSAWAWSCDVCGGVSGNATIGLLASTQFHMIGFKSGYKTYKSYFQGIQHSREYIFEQDITARWQVSPRWQILGSIPYQTGLQKRDLGSDLVHGLGDPQILVNRVLFHARDSMLNTRSFLSFGVGIKIPAGKKAGATSMIRNLYPSTGAWNLSGLLTYTPSISRRLSLQNEVGFTAKFKDSYGYKYGNTSSFSSMLVGNFQQGQGRWLVGVGCRGEYFGASTIENQPLEGFTHQGYDISGQLALHYIAKQWLWSMNIKQPIYQNFNQGSLKQGLQGSIAAAYLITKNSKK